MSRTQDAGDNKKFDSAQLTYANCNQTKALDVIANVKEQQLKVLNETIRNLQTQLIENKTKEKESLAKISALEQKLKQANVKELLLKTRIVAARKGSHISVSEQNPKSDASDKDVVCVDDDDDDDDNDDDDDDNDNDNDSENTEENATEIRKSIKITNQNVVNQQLIDANEARLIALISSFLVIHPFGASLENILLYVNQVTSKFNARDIENVLHRYKCIFSKIVPQLSDDSSSDDNVGENDTASAIDVHPHKWKFNGFDENSDKPLRALTIMIAD